MFPQMYPLAWPEHRARTPSKRRKKGNFTHRQRPIRIREAAERLEDEIERLRADGLVISSNIPHSISGRPRGTSKDEPEDPGVAIYFELKGEPLVLACDTYSTVAMNLAALAGHIEATRRIERYGVQKASEILKSFLALPGAGVVVKRPWWEVLGVPRSAGADEIRAAHRRRSKTAHPDRGGSDRQMAELNAAKDEALRGKA